MLLTSEIQPETHLALTPVRSEVDNGGISGHVVGVRDPAAATYFRGGVNPQRQPITTRLITLDQSESNE